VRARPPTSRAPERDLDPSFPSDACRLGILDVDALSDSEITELRALSVPPPIEVAPKRASGSITLPADALVPADIDRVGGKAADFDILRATAPDDSHAGAGAHFSTPGMRSWMRRRRWAPEHCAKR
jgi:hypothetical protein